jgi:hypothetical protein
MAPLKIAFVLRRVSVTSHFVSQPRLTETAVPVRLTSHVSHPYKGVSETRRRTAETRAVARCPSWPIMLFVSAVDADRWAIRDGRVPSDDP